MRNEKIYKAICCSVYAEVQKWRTSLMVRNWNGWEIWCQVSMDVTEQQESPLGCWYYEYFDYNGGCTKLRIINLYVI